MRRLIALAALMLSPSIAVAQSVSAVRLISFQQQSQGSIPNGRLLFSIAATPIAGQGGGFVMLFGTPAPPPDGPVEPVVCFHVASGPSTTSASMGSNPGTAPAISWAYSTAANCQTKLAAPINHVSIAYR